MVLRYLPRTQEGREIVRALRELESDIQLLNELRRLAKNDSGTRLSPLGRSLIAVASASGVKQAFMASLLDVTPGAISRQVNR
jgi:hypothetical protein